jgi:hypothetical protein
MRLVIVLHIHGTLAVAAPRQAPLPASIINGLARILSISGELRPACLRARQEEP